MAHPTSMVLHRVRAAARSRLLVTYLVASFVPVLLLMLAVPAALRLGAQSRGLEEARSQAALIGRTAVEPNLSDAPLTGGLSAEEDADLQRLSDQAVRDGHVVRLRVRNLSGAVVFADDGDVSATADDEVEDALNGEVVSRLTRLNADEGETAPAGDRVVEIYRPLVEGPDPHVVGVLEIYLPYGPIQAEVNGGLRTLTLV